MVKIKEFTPIKEWIPSAPESWGTGYHKEIMSAIELANEFLATLPDSHVINVKVNDGAVIVVYKEYHGNDLFMVTAEKLINELKRRNYILDIWQETDIKEAIINFNASGKNSEVTFDDIPKIIEYVQNNINNELGISWDYINMCIHDYVIERDRPIDYYMHG
jgi:hypothetical protein